MIRRILFFLTVLFFVLAGLNHFRDPGFYLPLIPDYFPLKEYINIAAGVAEIIFGLMLLIPNLRSYAVFSIIIMLVLFIPSHIWFIQLGSCVEDGLCVPAWAGWVRLLIIHPLLIAWILSFRNYRVNDGRN